LYGKRILSYRIWANSFKNSESCFWKNHGKLAHERNLYPKIIPDDEELISFLLMIGAMEIFQLLDNSPHQRTKAS